MSAPIYSTFSIVAYDPDTASWGVAVQSRVVAVGAAVPWARAGTGAIATQSRTNPRYGPAGLDLLDRGLSPDDVLDQLTSADRDRTWRQVGVVDARGQAAIYTGEQCFPWAGGRIGEGYVCQGNLLVSEAVVNALAETFERCRREGIGDLADWLVSALAAAQAAGGDRRGQQSAALLVVREGGGIQGLNDRAVDLRVDDHPAPISEVRRLLALHRDTVIRSRRPRVSLNRGARREAVELLQLLGYLPDTERSPLAVPDNELLAALARYAASEGLPEYVNVRDRTFAPALLPYLRLRAYIPPEPGTSTARWGVRVTGGRRRARQRADDG